MVRNAYSKAVIEKIFRGREREEDDNSITKGNPVTFSNQIVWIFSSNPLVPIAKHTKSAKPSSDHACVPSDAKLTHGLESEAARIDLKVNNRHDNRDFCSFFIERYICGSEDRQRRYAA